jgi:circadian clock protein KaiC
MHDVSDERVSSGIADLDAMLDGQGFYRGSSVLVSGMAGSGKSSMLASFADSVCAQDRRCIYFALEESPAQIIRNMRSIGLDLQKWIDRGLLRFNANRPTLFGLETHLASMHREVERFDPFAVVVDPISSLLSAGMTGDVHAMILRLIDFLKGRSVTAMFTSLTHGNTENAMTDVQVSSLMDSWLLLYNKETNGEHNRQLYLLKSRGMAHSNQVREFIMGDDGITLRDIYVGPEGMVTGSARLAQEARESALRQQRQQEVERRAREFERRRRQIETQVEELQVQLVAEREELKQLADEAAALDTQAAVNRSAMARSRGVAGDSPQAYSSTTPDANALRPTRT